MMLATANAEKALENSARPMALPAIEAGLYPAVIVGIQGVTTTYEGKVKEGFRFIFQYEDDEGQRWHIASKQFDLNFYEKSNFAKMFTQWTGCQNTPEEIMNMLKKGGFVDDKGMINWANFLGKHTALMLELKPSKKDPEKKFVELMSLHAPTKKTGRIEAKVEEKIPAFFGEIYSGTVDDAMYLEGIELAEKKEADSKDEKQSANTEKKTEKKAPKSKVSEADGEVNYDDATAAEVPTDEELPF